MHIDAGKVMLPISEMTGRLNKESHKNADASKNIAMQAASRKLFTGSIILSPLSIIFLGKERAIARKKLSLYYKNIKKFWLLIYKN